MIPTTLILAEKHTPAMKCQRVLREGTEPPETLSRMALAMAMYEEVNEWADQGKMG